MSAMIIQINGVTTCLIDEGESDHILEEVGDLNGRQVIEFSICGVGLSARVNEIFQGVGGCGFFSLGATASIVSAVLLHKNSVITYNMALAMGCSGPCLSAVLGIAIGALIRMRYP